MPKYSPALNTFFPDDIVYSSYPDDCVEVTEGEFHAAMHRGMTEEISYADGVLSVVPVAAPTLEQVRDEVWKRIQAVRDNLCATGGYQVAGYWFHSDQPSRTQQLGLVLLGANIPAGLQWKTMDGRFIQMTEHLAGQILAAASASDYAIFAAGESHKAAMDACADPASYDYSGGWPEVFSG